jgi:hypothetical protein
MAISGKVYIVFGALNRGRRCGIPAQDFLTGLEKKISRN